MILRRLLSWLPIIFAGSHSIAVVALTIWISQQPSISEAGMLWLLFILVDFPASLVVLLIGAISASWADATHQVINLIYAVSFAVFGGLQYYWIGRGIAWLWEWYSRRKVALNPERPAAEPRTDASAADYQKPPPV